MIEHDRDSPRIAIVGAGIGGLVLALALAERGVRCAVFEQAAEPREVGAGVQLAPNAVRPLHRLGLAEALSARAVRVEAREVRGWDGRPVARTPLGDHCERYFGAPYYAVHRAHLHRALLERLPSGVCFLGHRLERLSEHEDGVELVFSDGTVHHADLVIGADGIHSTVRRSLMRDAPVFSGLGVYRGLLPTARLGPVLRDHRVRLWLGPEGHLVCYPVDGGRLLSFAATIPSSAAEGESWTAPGDPADLLKRFGHWHAPAAEIATVAASQERVWRWSLYDREPVRTWTTGRVAVLGDAAHPMLPFAAQGASQAVEDAVDLAACLVERGHDEIPTALAHYEALRTDRVLALQRGARESAAVLHLPDGEEQRARDQAMKQSAALKNQAALFTYDAGRRTTTPAEG